MNYLMSSLSRKLLTNFGFSYLKASNNCFKSLLFSKIIHKNFSIINCNKIESTLKNEKHSKYSKLFVCNLIIKRNLSESDSEKVVLKSDKTNDLSNTESNQKQNLKNSLKTKFKEYENEDSEVILDVSEELMSEEKREQIYDEMIDDLDQSFYLYQKKKSKVKTLKAKDLKRGKTGVFDIEELVELLRTENMKDIAVIEVPQELKYCNFLVLANATSLRHLKAFIEYINKVYKMKKYRKDPFLDLGGNDSNDWKVVDMKNIVLHLFMKETRDYYDIETLWTVGEEYDDKTQRPELDPVVDIMEKHIKYLQEMKTTM